MIDQKPGYHKPRKQNGDPGTERRKSDGTSEPGVCWVDVDGQPCGKPGRDPIHQWVMPEWLEPYRSLIANTGGNSIEDLMSDHDTNGWNNFVRSALIIAVDSQITLLYRLRAEGKLS